MIIKKLIELKMSMRLQVSDIHALGENGKCPPIPSIKIQVISLNEKNPLHDCD